MSPKTKTGIDSCSEYDKFQFDGLVIYKNNIRIGKSTAVKEKL